MIKGYLNMLMILCVAGLVDKSGHVIPGAFWGVFYVVGSMITRGCTKRQHEGKNHRDGFNIALFSQQIC